MEGIKGSPLSLKENEGANYGSDIMRSPTIGSIEKKQPLNWNDSKRNERAIGGTDEWKPYTRVCCCFRVRRFPKWTEMSRFERRARIDYLWNRLRLAVKTGFFVDKEMKKLQLEMRYNAGVGLFGLDKDAQYEL